jgi:hypothetical protein
MKKTEPVERITPIFRGAEIMRRDFDAPKPKSSPLNPSARIEQKVGQCFWERIKTALPTL